MLLTTVCSFPGEVSPQHAPHTGQKHWASTTVPKGVFQNSNDPISTAHLSLHGSNKGYFKQLRQESYFYWSCNLGEHMIKCRLSFWTTESGPAPSLIFTAARVTVPEAGSLTGWQMAGAESPGSSLIGPRQQGRGGTGPFFPDRLPRSGDGGRVIAPFNKHLRAAAERRRVWVRALSVRVPISSGRAFEITRETAFIQRGAHLCSRSRITQGCPPLLNGGLHSVPRARRCGKRKCGLMA